MKKADKIFYNGTEKQPLITIVTVVLNDVKSIGKTIESVSLINYPNIEYIVIDGGSTDGTIDVINKNKKNINKFISEVDEGIFYAMNKGVMLAEGEYVNFLNAGDTHMPDFINHNFSEWKNKKIEYCHSNLVLTKYSKRVGIARPNINLKRIRFHLGSPLLHPTILISLKSFKDIGLFNTQYKLAADHDWVLRLLNSKKNGLYIDAELTNFDVDGASNNLKATKESKQILIINGLSKVFAFFAYHYFVFKKSVRSLAKFRNE
jgi:glycosyltransferase involved in cell wall biosynthesis